MAERRVSVRLAAVGGKELQAELVSIGSAGQRALDGIAIEGGDASRALTGVSSAADGTLASMEALAARATRAAAAMRAAGTASTDVMARIDRATGVTPAAGQSTRALLEQGRALDDLRAKYNPMFGTIRAYRAELSEIRRAHLEGAISAEEMSAAIARDRQVALASIAAIKGRSTALTQMAGAERQAAFQSRMLMLQLNDVFVSLASGMNPLMVFIQQGAQIQQIYAGQGGVNAALRQTAATLGGIVTRFPLVTAAVVAGTAALARMTRAINETSDATVGFGDTALAAWQTIRDGLVDLLRPAIEAIAPWFEAAWQVVAEVTIRAGNLFINTWRAAVAAVGIAWDTLPELAGAATIAAANAVVGGVETMVNRVIALLNGLNAAVDAVLSRIPGLDESFRVGRLGEVDFGGIDNPFAEGLRGRRDEATARIAGIMRSDPLGDFFGAVRDRAIANALDETGEAAGRAGGAMRQAGAAAAEGAERAKSAWETASGALADYASEAMDLGRGLGESLVGAFRSAEDAIGDFVKTGKADVRDLVGSIIADLARLSTRRLSSPRSPTPSRARSAHSAPAAARRSCRCRATTRAATPARARAQAASTAAAASSPCSTRRSAWSTRGGSGCAPPRPCTSPSTPATPRASAARARRSRATSRAPSRPGGGGSDGVP